MKKTPLVSLSLILLILISACDGGRASRTTYSLFSSDNGYSISYPDYYSPSRLSSSLDFVIFDDETGSSLTILSEEKKDGIADMSEDDFCELLKKDGIDTSLDFFSRETINETPCVVTEYSYGNEKVKQIIYDASDNTYTLTFTEMPGTNEQFSSDMTRLLCELKV